MGFGEKKKAVLIFGQCILMLFHRKYKKLKPVLLGPSLSFKHILIE